MLVERSMGATAVLCADSADSFIRDCVDSLLAQDGAVGEIVLVQREATPTAMAVARRLPGRVRLADAPGPDEFDGDVLLVGTGRARLAAGYVRRCLERLDETGATSVRGRTVAVGTTTFGRAVAALGRAGVFSPVIGCLARGERPQAGRRAVLAPDARCWWFVPDSAGELARASFSEARDQGRTGSLRRAAAPPIAAAAVVAVLVAAWRGPGWRRLGLPAAHAAACAGLALRAARDPGVAPHRAFAAAEIAHWTAGIGFLAGIAGRLRGGER